MNPQPLIKAQDLSVTLDNKEIIKDISFEIGMDEVIAIIGPNGAGKSILLKTLIGLYKPTKGTIKYKKNIQIGYLPQRFHLDYYLPVTVQEFLNLKENKKFSVHKIEELVGIENWRNKKLAQISSGQLQRVLLAWSVMHKPDILFLDEPTENVDIVSQESIYDLLRNLQDELHLSIIIVSHDLHAVYKYATKVICLNQKMVCYGNPHEALSTEKLSNLYANQTFFHHHHFGSHKHEH